jgi:atypical dual specificity phosphatase
VQNFSWLVEGEVAGMAAPDPSDAERLRAAGVTALVSLTRRPPFFDPPEGVAILHLPVVDMTPPSEEQLVQAVRFLESVVSSGGRAAVHCVAGYGRTGTVLAAYLVAKGEDPDEAIHRVREARPGSIETADQELAVHRFAGAWRKAARKGARERERERKR